MHRFASRVGGNGNRAVRLSIELKRHLGNASLRNFQMSFCLEGFTDGLLRETLTRQQKVLFEFPVGFREKVSAKESLPRTDAVLIGVNV